MVWAIKYEDGEVAATAPEPNSSRLTSLKLTRFDTPANNLGPWPASLGCSTGRLRGTLMGLRWAGNTLDAMASARSPLPNPPPEYRGRGQSGQHFPDSR